ncbi:LysR family transcriptional regulator [Rhodoferax antarcticus]|uniref:RubisCO operon transcriptional regulator cbbR n=1 Tax=Rhodoferax antarcticus ANT.BR TaxID=1111071 RepID=A0A1Q8YKS5_9BURK|nr:LysR family transcriptional regulator [Rhodoferax antarcticus]MCW2311991.1 DNA-binding transcriptional LysR family regulator [Rhodoferax antarcticus]OLP08500.1 RubisCO operon transcriptional regulator cbbR [Rhodoferax antarcticus ANT.BR]
MRPYTIKQIQTFMEVARQRSVSKAAERLFVTQPAVSMQIRQLEDAFGLALVEPLGRNIQLTAAGEAFLTCAANAMGQFKDLEALMAEHVGLKKGRLDLAVVSTSKYFIPMLLVRFTKLHPGIEVKLNIDNRDNVLALMVRNEADLVVMGRSPSHLDCEASVFATNPLVMVAPPDHPLARRKNLPFSALADYSFVVREEGSGTRAAMHRLFDEHHMPVKIAMGLPSNETIKQAVMAGMGLSFLSMRTIRHELAGGYIALLDVQGLPQMNHWYVTHLKHKKLSPATNAFKAFLLEQGGALMDTWS